MSSQPIGFVAGELRAYGFNVGGLAHELGIAAGEAGVASEGDIEILDILALAPPFSFDETESGAEVPVGFVTGELQGMGFIVGGLAADVTLEGCGA